MSEWLRVLRVMDVVSVATDVPVAVEENMRQARRVLKLVGPTHWESGFGLNLRREMDLQQPLEDVVTI